MTANHHHKPNAIEAYTVVLLENEGQLLLLQRSPDKRFAPNLWTGIGGKVERGEFTDIRNAALRELAEESGIQGEDVEGFTLRRALFLNRPGNPLTLLLYFTGRLARRVTPVCTEGRLFWNTPEELSSLDIIETTRPVLPQLIDDIIRDPQALEPVHLGLGIFGHDGQFESEIWDDPRPNQASADNN